MSERVAGVRSRWPVVIAVVVAIGLQVALPDRFTPGHRAVPVLELALLVVLAAVNPLGARRRARWVRQALVVFTAIITGTNAWSAVRLVQQIIQGKQEDALNLLSSGAAIWITNVIVFGLWYWQFDRGSPLSRLGGPRRYPDFFVSSASDPGRGAVRLGARLYRLSLPFIHQCDGIQPHGRDAVDRASQVRDDDPIRGFVADSEPRHRPGYRSVQVILADAALVGGGGAIAMLIGTRRGRPGNVRAGREVER